MAETGGGVGALHLIESGLRPDYCIVAEAGNLDVGLISVGYVALFKLAHSLLGTHCPREDR